METPQVNPEQTPQPSSPEAPQPQPMAPPPSPAPAPTQPVEVPVIPPNADPVPAPTASKPVEQGPAIADDADVIEKEWVEKVSEVVKKTHGDPHAEEEAVEDLQIDYLKKRYGLDVKKSKDE